MRGGRGMGKGVGVWYYVMCREYRVVFCVLGWGIIGRFGLTMGLWLIRFFARLLWVIVLIVLYV